MQQQIPYLYTQEIHEQVNYFWDVVMKSELSHHNTRLRDSSVMYGYKGEDCNEVLKTKIDGLLGKPYIIHSFTDEDKTVGFVIHVPNQLKPQVYRVK